MHLPTICKSVPLYQHPPWVVVGFFCRRVKIFRWGQGLWTMPWASFSEAINMCSSQTLQLERRALQHLWKWGRGCLTLVTQNLWHLKSAVTSDNVGTSIYLCWPWIRCILKAPLKHCLWVRGTRSLWQRWFSSIWWQNCNKGLIDATSNTVPSWAVRAARPSTSNNINQALHSSVIA